MTENRFNNIPFSSPIEPLQLHDDSQFCFNCYPGISCFNACCKQADITLTPYDILRLKNHLGLSSAEFLKKHTVPFAMDGHGTPGVKMRTTDVDPVCLLLDGEKGCSVYVDRPSACRYYPMGLLSSRRSDEFHDVQSYALVKESHCMGHQEPREISVAQYRDEQKVAEFDEYNREYYQIILKKKSAGPSIGKPSDTSFSFYFMVCFDTDRFKQFLNSPNFRTVYALTDEEFAAINNDELIRLKFGYRLLRQVLFAEESIPLVAGAYDKRMEQRRDILEARRQAEITLHQGKVGFEGYIEE